MLDDIGGLMASTKELTERWQTEPGCSIAQKVSDLLPEIWRPGHGLTSEAIFSLLDDLPFRGEVGNGRDLRGLDFGMVRELEFRACDFSHSPFLGSFIDCDLSNAIFDYAYFGSWMLRGPVNGASFRKARFGTGGMARCSAVDCNFEGANFEKCDLSGVEFLGS